MKTLPIYLAVALALAPVMPRAYTVEGDTITLSPADMKQCNAEGGCFVTTQKMADDAMVNAAVQALEKLGSRLHCKTGTPA
jgi:hypothetical protein